MPSLGKSRGFLHHLFPSGRTDPIQEYGRRVSDRQSFDLEPDQWQASHPQPNQSPIDIVPSNGFRVQGQPDCRGSNTTNQHIPARNVFAGEPNQLRSHDSFVNDFPLGRRQDGLPVARHQDVAPPSHSSQPLRQDDTLHYGSRDGRVHHLHSSLGLGLEDRNPTHHVPAEHANQVNHPNGNVSDASPLVRPGRAGVPSIPGSRFMSTEEAHSLPQQIQHDWQGNYAPVIPTIPLPPSPQAPVPQSHLKVKSQIEGQKITLSIRGDPSAIDDLCAAKLVCEQLILNWPHIVTYHEAVINVSNISGDALQHVCEEIFSGQREDLGQVPPQPSRIDNLKWVGGHPVLFESIWKILESTFGCIRHLQLDFDKGHPMDLSHVIDLVTSSRSLITLEVSSLGDTPRRVPHPVQKDSRVEYLKIGSQSPQDVDSLLKAIYFRDLAGLKLELLTGNSVVIFCRIAGSILGALEMQGIPQMDIACPSQKSRDRIIRSLPSRGQQSHTGYTVFPDLGGSDNMVSLYLQKKWM